MKLMASQEKMRYLLFHRIRDTTDAIVRNTDAFLDLNALPHPDYRTLPLEAYFEKFELRYGGFKPFKKSLPIYSRKGCIWRDVSDGGCVFCMIPHKGVRYRRPDKIWSELAFLNRKHGVDFFWEVSDTFTENSRWLERFLEVRPPGLDVALSIYGRPSNISRKMASLLRDLNVYEVFLGIESGDDQILARMNKGCRVDDSRRAVERLTEVGINVVVSFVLGLPGETSESLQKTVDFAQDLYWYGSIAETSASILLPIPGSRSFDMLMRVPGMATKHDTDLFDLEELKLDWVRNFTRTSPLELESALAEISAMFPLNNTFMEKQAVSAPMC
jgi:radical SAM superfamily enzyme YgiQ (UPF0313 family)